MNRTELMSYLLEEAEDALRYFLARQISEEGGRYDGAVPDPGSFNPPFPRGASSRLPDIITLWLSPASRFYGDPEIPRRVMKALGFLKREQRPSGNIDLWDCNFDSPPDSGFFLWDLIPLYRILEGAGGAVPGALEKDAAALRNELKPIILSVLEGLRAGGFHTANHRWVMGSSLAAGYNFTGNKAYLDRAREYLAEGIDCNEDGEYSERSAIYNAVNNQALITFYEELHDEQYLTFVQRNLRMLIHYFEGDGSFFTGNSTRQDRGRKVYAGNYFFQYLYIAHHLKDKEAARMAEYIAANYLKVRRPGLCSLAAMTLHPELEFSLTPADPPGLPGYNRYFRDSGIVRYRKGNFGYSLVQNNAAGLFFNSGVLSGCCKITLGFFNFGQVKITELEPLEEGYRFSYHADGWYFEPLETPGEPLINFRSEDHSTRRQQHPNHTDLAVTIRHREKGIDLSLNASGIDGVHYCFEFILPPGLPVSGDHFGLLPKPGDYILMKDGGITIKDGMDGLRISGGFADTELFTTSRNGEPRSIDSFTLYMNGTTPFSRTISIEAV